MKSFSRWATPWEAPRLAKSSLLSRTSARFSALLRRRIHLFESLTKSTPPAEKTTACRAKPANSRALQNLKPPRRGHLEKSHRGERQPLPISKAHDWLLLRCRRRRCRSFRHLFGSLVSPRERFHGRCWLSDYPARLSVFSLFLPLHPSPLG